HPYARVQLLTVARAQNQEWSHLILAGWNEGAWPPPAGAEFARAEEIRAFNRSVQQLNKRAARQGSQGEGHTSVRENHSLYLGPGEQPLIAFNTRRDSSKPAGEYDFALRPNESYRPVPTLSVSDLERMVSSPTIIWMKRYLGVEAPEDAANPWAATTGKWVHHWLANIIEIRGKTIFSAFPGLTKIDKRIRLAADESCAALRHLCDLSGKVVPDWWTSGWLNARYLARHLGAKIGGTKGWEWMATEVAVGREGAVKIADGVEL